MRPGADMDRIHNDPSLRRHRRTLRRRPTTAEAMVWKRLRRRQLGGRKFRRQHGVGRYVVDFSCAAERLVIELDGSVHGDPLRAQADTERQRWLEAQGLRVLRLRNEEVVTQGDLVLAAIEAVFGEPLPRAPSPEGEGERVKDGGASGASLASGAAASSRGTAKASNTLSPAPRSGGGGGGRGIE